MGNEPEVFEAEDLLRKGTQKQIGSKSRLQLYYNFLFTIFILYNYFFMIIHAVTYQTDNLCNQIKFYKYLDDLFVPILVYLEMLVIDFVECAIKR